MLERPPKELLNKPEVYNIANITIYTAYINTHIPFFSERHDRQTGF